MSSEDNVATEERAATAGSGRLAGKVAVVTGASSGIGRAAMELFGREGAKVVGTARREDQLREALETVESAGGEGIVVPADLEDSASADRIVDAALEAFGRIDVLVSNAGVGWQYGIDNPGTMAGIHEASLENWRDIIGGVDLEGYFLMIHAVLPQMLKQGNGSIVNLSRSMAISYAKQGVRTNIVCPGFVDTPMIAPVINIFDDADVAGSLTPMGRPAQPAEIANALLFFASDDSSYCNGSVLLVDVGCTARSFPG